MFCTNCGTKLNENGDFCTQCGMKIGESQINKKIIIHKRTGLISVIVVVVLVAIITLILVKPNSVNSSSVNSSAEKVAVATLKSEYEIDIETMVKCFPDFTIREIAVETGLSINASRSEVINEIKKDYRYETPQEIIIVRSQLVGEYDFEDYTFFQDAYDYMTDKEYDSITKVAKVNVEFIVDGEEELIQITCIKMKNKWYFLRDA